MDIKTLRDKKKELKLSFDELSRRSGIPKSTLTNIFMERTSNPRIDTVEAIERALGIGGQTLEWTEKDKALGVGNHPTYLSEDEWKWLELRNEILRVRGSDYLNSLETILQSVVE